MSIVMKIMPPIILPPVGSPIIVMHVLSTSKTSRWSLPFKPFIFRQRRRPDRHLPMLSSRSRSQITLVTMRLSFSITKCTSYFPSQSADHFSEVSQQFAEVIHIFACNHVKHCSLRSSSSQETKDPWVWYHLNREQVQLTPIIDKWDRFTVSQTRGRNQDSTRDFKEKKNDLEEKKMQ